MIDALWLLLLPVAAASGWLAARWDQGGRRHGRGDLPQAYLEGLNFLLNEQPDKAIEVFIRALEVDPDTVETHLAIGNLFRRRGEIERATRIHQNLIARPSLARGQRYQALYELAQDYHKAGLLDRAENLFQELVEAGQHTEPALRSLLDIYQQEKEWERAIQTCRRLGRETGRRMDAQIAQFYCEQADEAVARGDGAGAERLAARALGVDPGCVRANLLLGEAARGRGDLRRAIRLWRRVEAQDPQYLGEVVPRVVEAYRRLGDEEGLRAFLREALDRYDHLVLMLAMVDLLAEREGGRAAQAFVVDWLRQHPSAGGLRRLIQLRLAEAPDGAGRRDLEVLLSIIEDLLARQPSYACVQCGFEAKTLHWQCPSCKRWATVKPSLEHHGAAR